jgi:hypothetical protein
LAELIQVLGMHTCLIQGNLILVLRMSNNIREGETHTHTVSEYFMALEGNELKWLSLAIDSLPVICSTPKHNPMCTLL